MSALAIVVDMICAIVLVHWPNGFWMNWTGQQHGEGYEYHLLVIVMGLALVFAGAGQYSIDASLRSRRR